MIVTVNYFISGLFLITFTIFSVQPSTSYVFSNNTKEVPGLYDGFSKVTVLNTSNFAEEVFERQKSKLWIVEFYKHWCGDCIRFEPVLKSLAFDIYGWRDAVKIGVLDCANPVNTQVCRNKKVAKVPTLRIFHPDSNNSSLGVDYGKEGQLNRTLLTYSEIREKLAKTLKEYQNNQSEILSGSVNLKLLAHCDLERLWPKFPVKVKFLLLLFEDKDSLVGSQLALDLSETPEVRVRLVDPNNQNLYQYVGMERSDTGVVVLSRDSAKKNESKTFCVVSEPVFSLKTTVQTREGLNKAVRKFLISQGVNVSSDLPKIPIIRINVTTEQIQKALKREAELKKTLNITHLTSVVFLMDLEAAVNNAFEQEVSLTKYITGESLQALKNFVEVLFKYFPSGKRGTIFFKELKDEILNKKDEVKGKDLQEAFVKLKQKYNPFMSNLEWVGCRGTISIFRGYPCSMWTLFQSLVALEELEGRSNPDAKPEALNAMVGYIKHFFSCKVCSEHFAEMAKTIAGNVTTQRDAVMWLWQAHNKANRRLAGDQTEDPIHHKVQFPPSDICPSCYNWWDDSWNKDEVFSFLSKMYTNPNHYDPHQSDPSKAE